MNIRHPAIPPAGRHGGGPGEYCFRKTNARGQKRDFTPVLLRGDPHHFDHLAGLSKSRHPHLHCVFGYKSEPVPPSRKVRNSILAMYLRMLLGGLDPKRVYVLAVDHGDHDHVAMLRHLVTPNWRRFQPYFHDHHQRIKSDYQWLTNLRYGLNPAEHPRNAQLISLAGRRHDEEQIAFLASIREQLHAQELPAFAASHDAFVTHLTENLNLKTEIVPYEEDNDDGSDENEERKKSQRVYMKVTLQPGVVASLKGPLCRSGFTIDEYKEEQRKELQKYAEFARDPSQVWRRFLEGYCKKRRVNLELHPGFCEPDDGGVACGFDELEPSRYLQAPANSFGDIS
jgi:hypothetical protein